MLNTLQKRITGKDSKHIRETRQAHWEKCYKDFICPDCGGKLGWLPEAPGSGEGKGCRDCGATWTNDNRQRKTVRWY